MLKALTSVVMVLSLVAFIWAYVPGAMVAEEARMDYIDTHPKGNYTGGGYVVSMTALGLIGGGPAGMLVGYAVGSIMDKLGA